MWKHIEKRFRKRKVQEEEDKRKKAKKDAVDDKEKEDDGEKGKKDDGDKGKKGDGDKWKKDDGDNNGKKGERGKKGDGDKRKKGDEDKDDKRKRNHDDDIAGEELEEQIRAEVDREQMRQEMESIPEDTLEYVQDEGVQDDEDDADKNAVEEEVDDVYEEERDGDNDTSATSEEKIGSDDGRGERYAEKREEKKSLNFEEEMETLCSWLQLTHGHQLEEQLCTDRLIKAFRKKKKWLNWIAQKEDEERKVMAEKFDEDLRLCFQEQVEK